MTRGSGKGIIRSIKLYELGIIKKPDNIDILNVFNGLFKNHTYTKDTFITKTDYTNEDGGDIIFTVVNGIRIDIQLYIWRDICNAFYMGYGDTRRLTMWYIGEEYPHLKNLPTNWGTLKNDI